MFSQQKQSTVHGLLALQSTHHSVCLQDCHKPNKAVGGARCQSAFQNCLFLYSWNCAPCSALPCWSGVGQPLRGAQIPFPRQPNWFYWQERDLKPGNKSGRWKGLRVRPGLRSAGAGWDFGAEHSPEAVQALQAEAPGRNLADQVALQVCK